MDKPSRERVELLLECYGNMPREEAYGDEVGLLDLATEVRVLREELARADVEHVTLMELANRKLARVEALPVRWREAQPPFNPDPQVYAERCVYEQLTEDLEAALKGGA